jgi:hypothetical protein
MQGMMTRRSQPPSHVDILQLLSARCLNAKGHAFKEINVCSNMSKTRSVVFVKPSCIKVLIYAEYSA